MIHVNKYSHALQAKLTHKRVGNFSINKFVIAKGTIIKTYHPSGFFYDDRLGGDFPVVSLNEDGNILMSDAPMEQESYRFPITFARGEVLIIGLGIGLFSQLLKERNKTVDHITVVELNEEVKSLVWNTAKRENIELIIGDGKEYLKSAGRWYDYIFVDVWGSVNGTLLDVRNWQELAESCLKEGGMANFWLEALYNRVRQRLDQGPTAATSAPGVHDPCLICGKKLRFDYAGLCADCADVLGLSEYFVKKGGHNGTRSPCSE